MEKRGLGIVLVLAFVIASAALLQDFRYDRSVTQERVSVDSLTRRLDSTQLALANLRGAQAGYLAVGQTTNLWMKRAGDLAAEVEKALNDLQVTTKSAEAKARYDSALSALGGLNSLDQKARDEIGGNEKMLASDVLFMDATESAQRLTAELEAARDIEYAASEARMSGIRRARFQFEAAALAMLVIGVAFFAGRLSRTTAQAAEAAPLEIIVPRAVQPIVAPSPVAAPVINTRVNLSDAAQICTDLARVLDGQDVPPLLERCAQVLGAKGLVLWVTDGSGAMLRAAVAHGYAERILHRLGPLQVDGDNVTSLAFRSMQAQTFIGASKGAPNAIAVPLITSSGCVGVLAAEVPSISGGGDTMALAKLFAAQLATIMTPVSEAAEEKTAQA